MGKEDYSSELHALLVDDPSYKLVLINTLLSVINKVNKVSPTVETEDISICQYELVETTRFSNVNLLWITRDSQTRRKTKTNCLNTGSTIIRHGWLTLFKLVLLRRGSSTAINDSDEFLQMIIGVTIAENETMVSIKVISLFTFIPKQLAKVATAER